MYKVSVIGFGYWGPNIVRNFSNHSECEVRYICDLGKKARDRILERYTIAKNINSLEKVYMNLTDN